MLVVGGLEQFSRTLTANDSGSGEDSRSFPGAHEPRGDLSLNRIHQHAAADGRCRCNGSFQAGNLDHCVSDGRAGIQNEIRKVLQLLSARMLAASGFRMLFADDGHDLHSAILKSSGHFDWHEITSARRGNKRAIVRRDLEIAKNAFGKAADVFKEHGLTLTIWADDKI